MIKRCSLYGVYTEEGGGLKIILNTIKSNGYGIYYNENVSIGFPQNNIYNNTGKNFYKVANGVTVYITNIWWGSTIVSNIAKGITNESAGIVQFIPYRLFGEFCIQPGADITTVGTITNLTTYISENTNIVLNSWTKINDPDFKRYRIYRKTTASFSNLTPASCIIFP